MMNKTMRVIKKRVQNPNLKHLKSDAKRWNAIADSCIELAYCLNIAGVEKLFGAKLVRSVREGVVTLGLTACHERERALNEIALRKKKKT